MSGFDAGDPTDSPHCLQESSKPHEVAEPKLTMLCVISGVHDSITVKSGVHECRGACVDRFDQLPGASLPANHGAIACENKQIAQSSCRGHERRMHLQLTIHQSYYAGSWTVLENIEYDRIDVLIGKAEPAGDQDAIVF